LPEIKRNAVRMALAVLGVGNADGLSAVSAATAMLLGLLARERGAGGQAMLTTMLSSVGHALGEAMTVDAVGSEAVSADAGLYGFGALYRLYETADGWVFLAAPSESDWVRLAAAMVPGGALRADRRFSTAASRRRHGDDLAAVLAELFLERPARDWETCLRAAGVACVEVAHGPVESNYLDADSLGRSLDLVTTAQHPIFGDVPRLKPLVGFSRSATVADGAPLCGDHTTAILREVGYSDQEIEELRTSGVIGG
jgi:crotonobetainyl-CoA:carnitine CoA-transferase CaiB-like acyl-CoA transferase